MMIGAEYEFSDAVQALLEARYLRRDPDGKVNETPAQLFTRVASSIANVEGQYGGSFKQVENRAEEFYELMITRVFLPNSPTLMNAGRNNGLLSACVVLPVEDSIDGIFSSILHTAMIQKSGGGTGFSFSRLRPKGDYVSSSGGTTSGPIAFMNVFSSATSAIQQGAFRRGANMGVLRVDHPDIIDFIDAKKDLKQLTNFNLSVAVTDEFMRQVLESPTSDHVVCNPRTGASTTLLKQSGAPWKTAEVFAHIAWRAWETGEPGIIYIDQVNRANPTPQVGPIEATNPCGEQPLLPYESCNLGSINLSKLVKHTTSGLEFDTKAFKRVIATAVRFLDNVIDANHYPIPECESIAKANRKIGLGVMGFADLLTLLNIPYDSDQALVMAEEVMALLSARSHIASRQLAQERGVFPNWEKSIWGAAGVQMRNAATTTIAPTGSVSILAECSGGIEPLFSVVFERNILEGRRLLEINKHFLDIAKERGFYSDALLRKIHERGSLEGMPEIPPDVQRVFVTAHDVSPDWHVRMQAAFQKHCDAAVSKTVNLAHDATAGDVQDVFIAAHKLGCKGITIYRDGCRKNQPMALASNTAQPEPKKDPPQAVHPLSLPEIMPAIRIKQASPFGNIHINIIVDSESGHEREVFAQLGKGGDLANSDLEAICRLMSLYLRVNGSIDDVVGQLRGIGSSISIPTKEGRICSLADGLARGLEKYIETKNAGAITVQLAERHQGTVEVTEKAVSDDVPSCDGRKLAMYRLKCTCGAELSFTEGCMKCFSCGYAEC